MDDIQKKYFTQINELVQASVQLGLNGYVTSHGGNLSYRVDENVVLITPTMVPKKSLAFDDIVIINFNREVLFAGNGRRPTGEVPMHLNIYLKRPDIKSLIHAHPPYITGFSLVDSEILSRPLLPELIIEIGPAIYVDYKEPISDSLALAFNNVIDKSNAFIMRNHGVIICSPDGAGRCFELLEMLENSAHSVFVAGIFGKVNEIPLDEVDNLEKTLRTRNIPTPGKPGKFKRLRDLYSGVSEK